MNSIDNNLLLNPDTHVSTKIESFGMLVLPLTVLQPPLPSDEIGHECDHCNDNYVNQGFLLTQCSEGDLPIMLLVRSILP